MRVLLCEDDDLLARVLMRALRRAGHDAVRVAGVTEAWAELRRRVPDLALVDLSLPDGHGSQVVQRLREHPHLGIIVLTAHGDERSRVLGLRSGADDYVVKPFSQAELLARIDALDRRTRALRPREEGLTRGDLHLDLSSRTLRHGEQTITLTGKEGAILAVLMQGGAEAVPREHILDEIWPGGQGSSSRSLDTHIATLRGKLPAGARIVTVRGIGYRLEQASP